jgi:heme/copper-type cytochrome/quinol oxidase subunit 1
MTTTETAVDTGAQAAPAVSSPRGVAGVLGSGDHTVVGRVFIGASLILGALSAIALALGTLGNLGSGGLFIAEVNLRLFTAGQIGLVFGFALPFFLGLGLLVVPLQVGASSVAFPRAAAMALWVWLAGAVTMGVAVVIDGGIGGGNTRAVDLAFIAIVMLLVGLLLGAVCVATTALTLRSPGMTFDRVPMFTWSMVAAAGIWVLTWPVLMGNLILIRVDLVNGQTTFGSATGQWAAVAWAFMQPQIYVLAIPVLGVLGDLIPALTGRRQVSRNVMLAAIGAFAALSIGSWSQIIQLEGVWTGPFFVIVSFAIILPVLAAAGGWGSLLAQGKPRPSAPLEVGATGTPMAAVGQAGFILAAVAAAALGAAAWWAPKISGDQVPMGLGILGALAALGGGVLWGLGLVLAGASARFSGLEGALDALVVIAAVGMVFVAGALILGGLGLLAARGTTEDDPWGTGQTLEWATASPPAIGNFEEVPAVTSAEPLCDLRGDGDDAGDEES